MFNQQHRLKKKRDIEIVFENGRFVASSLSTMKLWHVDPEKFPKRSYSKNELKIAVVVSKKVSKSAVKRNRLKRQMREVIRLLLKKEALRQGNYIVLMAKPEMLGKAYAEIEKDIVSLLKKARLLSS